jgi:hypothetical protein
MRWGWIRQSPKLNNSIKKRAGLLIDEKIPMGTAN